MRGADCISGNLRAGSTRSGKVIGVLPSTLKSKALCVYFQMYSPSITKYFPNACCEAGVEFIAVAGAQRRGGHAGAARYERLERVDHRVVASLARQHQVLVERSLHGAGIGNAQDRVGRLDIVGDAQARLGLRGAGDAVVFVEAQPEIEGPVVDGDGVLDVESEFLDVGMAVDSCTGRWWYSGSRRKRAAAPFGSGRNRPEAE